MRHFATRAGFVLLLLTALVGRLEAAEQRLVSTSATGEVEATPDIAIVQGQVREERKDADDAVRAARENLDRVIVYLKDLGVDTADIRAAQILVNPQWHYPRNQPRELTGYEARAEFSIKLKRVELLGRIHGGLIDAGASEFDPTRFDFSNRDQLELEAIARAVKLAQAKAEAALAPLGAKVGEIQNLAVNTHWQEPPGPRPERMAVMSTAKSADTAPQVNIGNHTLSANVNASFKIK